MQKYCTLGAAHASLPRCEIITYLGSKLFERMACISEQLPTDAEVEKFASDNGLTHAALFKRILDNTSYQMPLIQLDYKMFTNMSEDDLALLDEMYMVKAVQPVDMFPHTHHVENVVLLTLREA
jgi:hypothetical protein